MSLPKIASALSLLAFAGWSSAQSQNFQRVGGPPVAPQYTANGLCSSEFPQGEFGYSGGGCDQSSGAPCITEAVGCNRCASARMYFGGDYLHYFIKNAPVSFPVATGSAQANQGVLGLGGTNVILGNQDIDYGNLSGVRINGGGWLNCDRSFGYIVKGFLLESKQVQRTDAGNNEVLARPFFDVVIGQENARLLTTPGAFQGGIAMNNFVRLWGADVNPIVTVLCKPNATINFIGGFKFLSLDEQLDIYDRSTSLDQGLTSFNGAGFPGPGVTSEVHDRFATHNQFYGGTVGGMYFQGCGKWEVFLTGKCSLGTVHQVVSAAGTTTLSGPNPAPVTVNGGLLAVGSNIGSQSRNSFAVLPEADVKIGYQITPCFTVYGGYNFMYLNNVVRPGDQISRNIDHTLIPSGQGFGVPGGSANPAPQFNTTDFWAHGVSLGMYLKF